MILLGGIAATAVAITWRRRLAHRRQAVAPDLRRLVLSREFLKQAGATPGAAAAVMDWNVGGGAGTLVAFHDGAVSLYFSSGGGIIGAGMHDQIRAPATQFHPLLSQNADLLSPTTEYSLPPAPKVVFWLVRNDATLRSAASDPEQLAGLENPFSAVHACAQATISALREFQGG